MLGDFYRAKRPAAADVSGYAYSHVCSQAETLGLLAFPALQLSVRELF